MERKACRLLGLHRSTCRYVPSLREELPLRQRRRAIAQARPRCDYRRIYVLLKCEGYRVGNERVRRLYDEEGLRLQLKTKPRRKMASHLRPVPVQPTQPHARWSIDFMVDSLIDGRRFRLLTVRDILVATVPLLRRIDRCAVSIMSVGRTAHSGIDPRVSSCSQAQR